MRRSHAAALAAAGILVGHAALAGLQALALNRQRVSRPPAQRHTQSLQKRNFFDRGVQGEHVRLRYDFADQEMQQRRVECSVSRTDLARRIEAFGVNWDHYNQALERSLESYARERLGLPADRASSRCEDKGRCQSPRMAEWQIQAWRQEVERLEAALLGERGIVIEERDGEHFFQIDYPAISRQNADVLGDCFVALGRQVQGRSVEDALDVFSAFVQEMPYKIPPDRASGKEIFGYWVPADVLTRNEGDCDSKANAFTSLWSNWQGRDTIIVLVPGHAFIGVAMPRPFGTHVRIGNTYFVLVEMTDKWRPGVLPPDVRPALDRPYVYYRIPGRAEPVRTSPPPADPPDAREAPAAPSGYGFWFRNECRHPVRLAIKYKPVDGDWVVDGWWEFEPDEGAWLADDGERLRTMNGLWYYFAETTGASQLVWQGDEPVRFESTTLGMRAVRDDEGDNEWTITCPE